MIKNKIKKTSFSQDGSQVMKILHVISKKVKCKCSMKTIINIRKGKTWKIKL